MPNEGPCLISTINYFCMDLRTRCDATQDKCVDAFQQPTLSCWARKQHDGKSNTNNWRLIKLLSLVLVIESIII